jgi:dolichol-phosphate mannosyltransferase
MIAIVIPTLNECNNLRRLLPLIDFELGSNYKVIIVDDNSKDGTQELVKDINYPIKLIVRPSKMGYASAISVGIKEAIKGNADIIVTMDADLSHNPVYLRQMIQDINGYDVIIGSRYNHGGVKDTKLVRLIISRLGNYIADKVLGLNVKDCTSGYRVYKGNIFNDSSLNALKSVDGYGYLIMITNILVKRGLKIKEFPIVFEDRYNGKSKISKWIILEALAIVLLLGIQNKTKKR